MTTKIKRSDFKNIIKECIIEMVKDGSLASAYNQRQETQLVQQQLATNPMVRIAASQAGKNPNEIKILENILADTAATTMQEQMQNDPFGSMDAGVQFPQGIAPQSGYQPQPQNLVHVPQAQPFYAQQSPQYLQQPLPQQQRQAPASTWARLAFNSPIKNRPNADGSSASGALPGQNFGNFG